MPTADLQAGTFASGCTLHAKKMPSSVFLAAASILPAPCRVLLSGPGR